MSNNGIWTTNSNNPYPQSEFLDPNTKRPSRSWQLFFLNLLNFTSSPQASKGNAVLPTNPVGFINVTVDGKSYKVPYYNQ